MLSLQVYFTVTSRETVSAELEEGFRLEMFTHRSLEFFPLFPAEDICLNASL